MRLRESKSLYLFPVDHVFPFILDFLYPYYISRKEF